MTKPSSRTPTSYLVSKVPEATALFWLIKICTTGMGETASDFMGTVPVVIAALLVTTAFAALVTSMYLQFKAQRYVPWIYWFAVAMISTFGTMVSDGIRTVLGLSYIVTSVGFSIAVAACLILWYRSEGTLSIHSITTRRREWFYWATVMSTFALGTAVGDMTAMVFHLGFLGSGFLFIGLILVPLIAHYGLDLNGVLAFWWAYVITRPLGASFADWSAVPKDLQGLNHGTGPTTLVAAAAFVVLVAIASIRHVPGRAPVVSPVAEFEG